MKPLLHKYFNLGQKIPPPLVSVQIRGEFLISPL